MFEPRKIDPLVNIATAVMKEGDLRRDAERLTNEKLGVFSRRELPHERHAEYDALLVQNVDEALGKAKTLTEDTEQPVTINETRQQTLERFIREQKKHSKKDEEDNVDENFESIKRAKANWDKANKGTKAEKQKNEILGWHDKSHKKQDSDETKTK